MRPSRHYCQAISIKIRSSADEQVRRSLTAYEEGEHQAELERKRWAAQMEQLEREEAKRRAAEALKDSKEELLEIIEMWATSKRLEEFFADAEHKLKNLAEGERTRSMERLRRARKLIGSTDALERFQSWKAPEER